MNSELTKDSIMKVIYDERYKNKKLWTASVVLDVMGIYRMGLKEKYDKNLRLRARKFLKELCDEGHIQVVKSTHTLHSINFVGEVAYGRKS